MRTVWTTVLSVWAVVAVVAVLVWTRPQPVATPSSPQVVVSQSGAGAVAQAQTTHATTRTSPVPAG